MYYKERENSQLYLHYQKKELARLQKKVDEIKTKRNPLHSTENLQLPSITQRSNKANVQRLNNIHVENKRLSSRINCLQENRSEYFAKVIQIKTPPKHAGIRMKEKIYTNEDTNNNKICPTNR